MVDTASWVGANLDDLSALTAIYDDGLSRLLVRLLLPDSLALAPFTFGFLISNSTLLIPSQESAFAGIPRH
jgi:hypothetical protein